MHFAVQSQFKVTKVIDFGSSRKRVCNFLLVTNFGMNLVFSVGEETMTDIFLRFNTTPECDRQSGGQTDLTDIFALTLPELAPLAHVAMPSRL